MEFKDDLGDLWKLKDLVISKVDIVELIKEYEIILEPKETGQFTHRAPCPFHKETNPSFYVSAKTNSFFCYGCNKSGNQIHFVSFIEGCPPTFALKKLAIKVGLIDRDGNVDENIIIEKPAENRTIDLPLMEISSILRNYVKRFVGTENFEREFKYAEKIGNKVDDYLLGVSFEDYEYVEALCEKVKSTFKNRLKRLE